MMDEVHAPIQKRKTDRSVAGFFLRTYGQTLTRGLEHRRLLGGTSKENWASQRPEGGPINTDAQGATGERKKHLEKARPARGGSRGGVRTRRVEGDGKGAGLEPFVTLRERGASVLNGTSRGIGEKKTWTKTRKQNQPGSKLPGAKILAEGKAEHGDSP